VALAVATPSAAGPITGGGWTGNAELDFPSMQDGIITLVNPKYPTTNPEAFIAGSNLSPGWSIKDIRLNYDRSSDVMYVGVNFFGIAGDADGNGDPGTISPALIGKGAVDMPNLGGRESITIGLDMTRSGRPNVLAGVPADKRQAGSGLLGFGITSNLGLNAGVGYSYGSTLSNNVGGLLFNPSAQRPDFIFSIANFSKLPGYDPENGFGLIAYAGTPDDSFPEEGVLFPRVAFGRIPEPATVLGWTTVIAVGAAWRHARRRGRPGDTNA
jgi:hypothetical protein